MRLVKDDERADTLAVLNRNLSAATLQLRALPVAADTPAVRRRRRDIETKLAEIEKAIDLFSQPKVYIAID